MLYHALTSPVADVTGTVTVFNSAGQTTTAAASQIVRPSDWNSAHVEVRNFGGNTAGTSQISGTNLYFAGGNNVTLSANGQTVSIVAAAGGGGGVALSAGTNSTSTGTVAFQNSNGVSFGMDTNGQVTATVKTDYLTTAQPVGAYLTTAALSNHSHNLATTTTNGSQIVIATTNSNGATMAVPAFLTTAQPVGAYLTTARASNDAIGLNTALTAGPAAVTANSSGLSLNFGSVAGTSTGFAGNLISASMTHNTAGLNVSMNHPAWLTTAALSQTTSAFVQTANSSLFQHTSATSAITSNAAHSTHSHGNPTLALTNLSGTTASASNGFTLSLSAAAPGGGGTTNQTGPNIADGNGNTITSGTVVFSNANSVSFGLNGQTMTGSIPNFNTANVGFGFSGTNASATLDSNGMSLSVAAGGGSPQTATMWFPFNEAVNVAGQIGQGTLHFVPVPTPGNIGGNGIVSIDRVCWPVIFSNTSNTTGSITISQWFGLYERENTTGSRITLMHSTSFSSQIIFSGTTNNSIVSGMRIMTCPWSTSFNDNRYIVANLSRTTSGGANATFSQLLVSNINSNFSGILGVASNATAQWPLGWGAYSATTSGLPNSVAYSQIQGTNSLMMRNPEWFMVNGTA